MCGWWSRRRNRSPPAYPEPPTIETVSMFDGLIERELCGDGHGRKVCQGIDFAASNGEHIIYDLVWNIYARRGDAVAKFDGVVYFVDQKPTVGIFHNIHAGNAAPDRFQRRNATRIQLG